MSTRCGSSQAEDPLVHLDAGELHRLLAGFARFGAQPQGGISRLTGSSADAQARGVLVELLRQSGAEVQIDSVGNVFGMFQLAGPAAPLVMSGSHLDTQANAGHLDGAYGVIAALCAARALAQAGRLGRRYQSNLCVVNWCNEEGARFRPSTLGSGSYAGAYTAEFALTRMDDAGISLGDALGKIGFLGQDAAPPMPKAYLELHIEQGARLEKAGMQIGIVTGNWGVAKLEVAFIGEAAHTGPTPMSERRDALLAASRVVGIVRALAEPCSSVRDFDNADVLHSCVGRLLVHPNSSNVVPARVDLSIELRSPNKRRLDDAVQALDVALQESARFAGVQVEVQSRSMRHARAMPASGQAWIAAAAKQIGASSMHLETVAGHDALALCEACPVGLMFVPSIGGISHHAAESTHPCDLEVGLQVLTAALCTLCETPVTRANPHG